MGESTISTGPFSIAFCKRLPEGNSKNDGIMMGTGGKKQDWDNLRKKLSHDGKLKADRW